MRKFVKKLLLVYFKYFKTCSPLFLLCLKDIKASQNEQKPRK